MGNKCRFIDAFTDKCDAIPQMGDDYCPEHLDRICALCGNQATYACPHPGPSGGPCGFPICHKVR